MEHKPVFSLKQWTKEAGRNARGGARPVSEPIRPQIVATIIQFDGFGFEAGIWNMKVFIEGVRVEPCLWNPLHPEYRETQVKDEAWQRVVDHYNNSSIPNSKSIPINYRAYLSKNIGT